MKPIALKNETEQQFLSNIKELISNKDIYNNAQTLSESIKAERGLEDTVRIIERQKV